jgi:hypothetical protein
MKNISPDGVERNRKFSAYEIQKMEMGYIDLDLREQFLENRVSRSAKRFTTELEAPLSAGSLKSYFQYEY